MPSTATQSTAPAAPTQSNPSPRERIAVSAPDQPDIALQRQPAAAQPVAAQPVAAQPVAAQPVGVDVVYVHGATFGADLSVFFPFDGRSWADGLAAAGFTVWGFDFVGFGSSGRYATDVGRPAGDIHDAMGELGRVVQAVRQRNGDRPVVLLAHSHGGVVAARYAGENAADVQALILFAPIVPRPVSAAPPAALSAAPPATPPAIPTAAAAPPSHYPLSVWAQYRRFIDDVPKGQPQVIDERHMQAWSAAYLASDPASATRMPPSVMTPFGPIADIGALWSGKALYDPAKVLAPTLVIKGAWDSLCTDADAQRLLQGLGAQVKEMVTVPRATHLMQLEQQRDELYAQVNRFLHKVLA